MSFDREAEKRLNIDQLPNIIIPDPLTVEAGAVSVADVSLLTFVNATVSGTSPSATVTIPSLSAVDGYPKVRMGVQRTSLATIRVKAWTEVFGSDTPLIISPTSDVIIDISATGLNGRDESIDPVTVGWYYVWLLIAEETATSTQAVYGMFGTSSTTPPAMPSGYSLIASRRIGAARVYYSSGSDIRLLGFDQLANDVIYWGDFTVGENNQTPVWGAGLDTELKVISRDLSGTDLTPRIGGSLNPIYNAVAAGTPNSYSFLFGSTGSWHSDVVDFSLDKTVPPSAEGGSVTINLYCGWPNTFPIAAPANFPTTDYPESFLWFAGSIVAVGSFITPGAMMPLKLTVDIHADGSFVGEAGLQLGVVTLSPDPTSAPENREWLLGLCTGYRDVL